MSAIKVGELAEAIADSLTIYGDDVTRQIKKLTQKKMNELVRLTKKTAPVGKRKSHYKDAITSRKENESYRSVTYLWYVKAPEYRLSHLLEHGHATRNGGRTKAFGFIGKANDKIQKEYEKEVEEVIDGGS